MKITMVKGDLFTADKDCALCHCISADFALGAGIAREFAKRGVKKELFLLYGNGGGWAEHGYCLFTSATEFLGELNLVTKEHYYDKPTLTTLRQALENMRDWHVLTRDSCYYRSADIWRIAMPKIGCGLDRLDWDDVQLIIEDVFKDVDVEIIVYEL